MASSSSSSPRRTWRYRVFTSFHGPDVRKTFLTHLRKQFNYNGISMFNDQGIERGQTIAPALTQAIGESRISIVVLTKNYASSSWCLDELVEIFKCKDDKGQIVMTVFYGVDPSDVRKQTGDFGIAFNETCDRRTEEERRRWSQALKDVGNIAGEHFLNWDNESKMIEKIAKDVSDKLNATISSDFQDMVGIEAHLQNMQSLLHLDNEDEAMIVGISGPAGIGKTTIARALHCRLSSSFQLTCFMENIRGSYNRGLDEYGLKLHLQDQFLSKILNQNGMSIYHLRAIQERLHDQKVLIILDDVDDLQQLEALANETNWFGPGSRIIITTEDQELLEQHDINNTYHVDFPTNEEARKIFCRYAFRRSLAPYGFEKLVERVIELCGNLPLGLRVMGSTLRGKREDDWEGLLRRLENSIDRTIEGVLRVGYDNLHKDDQLIFLLIAFFFNYEDDDHVMAMLAESNVDVTLGLKTLTYKSLIQISTEGKISMHKLLQQVGREAVQLQEPTKRQIIVDAHEICDVLDNDSASRNVLGISFDLSKIIGNMCISSKAFKRMRNLQFINIYESRRDRNVRVYVPDDMDFPPRLRVLHWEVYLGKCLPRTFSPEYLVELDMENNELEKLWEGTQLLKNLKRLLLARSYNLKELPDLSSATSLERLNLNSCKSLVEIPSSIGNLQKLECLVINFCSKLQVVPTLFNLTSLDEIFMLGCWQLRKVPDFSTNVTSLVIADTMLEHLFESLGPCSRLECLTIVGSVDTVPRLGEDYIDRTGPDIERIPDWIKDLRVLDELCIIGCPKIVSLPELPGSLRVLEVHTCESLETISSPLEYRFRDLFFSNCLKLGGEARRAITQPSVSAYLPGREIPAEFNHRAIGNYMIVPSSFCKFRFCVVVTPIQEMVETYFSLVCRIRINGSSLEENIVEDLPDIKSEHLFMYPYEFLDEDGWLEQDKEILFEFSNPSQEVSIIECGVQILTDETDPSRSSYGSCEDKDENLSDGSYESCLEQVFEDDNENVSHGPWE
ncbi:unnamed protein product [Microthlaspi erraticum]|uniref:ADP-ribosyl cyclase/cyclic ADP-ribose hydrolase n=1 Tax=Microthlaspi erraticum TaxID=1685480 RepID=A0A6D2KNJ2_9BRAS|nr:unnamed protein product [Microthlaspi erraticum]